MPDPREELPTAMADFHHHLIWGRYPEAAGYLPEGQRGHFVGAYEEIGDDVRFIEYEVGTIDLDAEAKQAIVMVTIRWYEIPYYVVEETRVRETWQYDEETEYWWLIERADPEALPSAEGRARGRPGG
jgi:hypothetical protein